MFLQEYATAGIADIQTGRLFIEKEPNNSCVNFSFEFGLVGTFDGGVSLVLPAKMSTVIIMWAYYILSNTLAVFF